MRSILFALSITIATACASSSSPRPGTVNIAAVRSDINDSIRSTTNDRSIHSMGKVTPDQAVVYTTSKDGATKQEEVWVREGDAWKQQSSTKITASATR